MANLFWVLFLGVAKNNSVNFSHLEEATKRNPALEDYKSQ
jgi:hypothetical protein